MIQGGDPNAKIGYGPTGTLEGGDKSAIRKWGTGGPGYTIPAEFNDRLHEVLPSLDILHPRRKTRHAYRSIADPSHPHQCAVSHRGQFGVTPPLT